MNILLGLIPALAWGIQPIIVSKIGGKPANQILGTTAGALVVAIFVALVRRPEISPGLFGLSFLSGACWVIGQMGQFIGYQKIGVAKTMPISTGLQIIGTSIIGVIIFKEWPSATAKIFGFAGLAAIVVGIFLTSLNKGESKKVDKGALTLIVLTTFGFLAYSSIPALKGVEGLEIFLPQALGMLSGAVVYLLLSRQFWVFKCKTSWLNLLTGFVFAVGALSYILSAQVNGIATGFTLAQLNVVISTIMGIFVLKEGKSRVELTAAVIGLILIMAGASATVFPN